ncbi:Fusaristatin A biosynthesis cluster [Hyphodiscus hymeniophilus]|uniref:Fusaristatin A biosynthesis cluster n=1 Tax=Hyphodiscus hymeniophilus TaxID=353542 RepID=A0A9P6SQY1_9HELO|nr:Fusaristatin A biosynthesis cluster [Hyphodiscus hymeniophilus]
MPGTIIRVTMFKIPSEESRAKLVEYYKTLVTTAVKDGAPYIVSLQAGPLIEDPRSAGFTFAAKSEFKTVEDMKYYDEGCEAHQALKEKAKPLGVEGMMMVYYDPVVVA